MSCTNGNADGEIEQFAEEIYSHASATGRQPREIIQCMIDEGYVEMDDEAVEECVRLVEEMTQ
mgnify:CR=1 FL=1